MKIIDTHSHIYTADFDGDIATVIANAHSKGITHILMPNIDLQSIQRLHNVSEQFAGVCLPMMGLHPTEVKDDWQDVLAQMRPLFEQRKYVAVGEVGMDLYWDTTFAQEQAAAFKQQLQWAKELRLPVSIHSRNAHSQTMDCLRQMADPQLVAVMHSFGGTADELDEILSMPNLYVGINGVVTFKNSGLREVLKNADLQRIVVETDAPYLTPAPFRGKRNEPAHCSLIVSQLADVFGLSPQEVARITTQNACRVFGVECVDV